MKKFFTLVCGLAMAICANAATAIGTSFSAWDEKCVVDGNALTFTAGWAGAGMWIGSGDNDFSDYDYLWVTFSESTCDFNLVVEHTPEKNAITGEFNSGTLVAGVALNEALSDHVMQYYLQSKSAGKLVVTGAYVGTEEEYKAVLAGNKPQKSDLTLSNLGSGWGNSTYDAASKTVTIGEDWTGKGWWLDKADYSDFDKVVVNFATPTATNGKLIVEYVDADAGAAEFAEGATSVEVALDAAAKNSVKQIYLQGPAGAKFVLADAYVCVKDYVSTGISQTVAAPAVKSSKVFNLAGQQVGKSFKGVVIKNGKKYVQ